MKMIRSGNPAEYENEAAVMSGLRHPNIVLCFGMTIDPLQHQLALVMEFCGGGTLGSILYSKKEILSTTDILNFASEIASGMAYLHGRGILHRDLKSDNILLDDKRKPKIADFGLARVKPNSVTATISPGGDYRWSAPEVIESAPHNQFADVYSYAMLLFELCYNLIPPVGSNMAEIYRFIVVNGSRPPLKPDPRLPTGLLKLIQDCWAQNANNRPVFSVVLSRLSEVGSAVETEKTEHAAQPAPGAEAQAQPGLAPGH
jgi:serine/threonine protein kinase